MFNIFSKQQHDFYITILSLLKADGIITAFEIDETSISGTDSSWICQYSD
jgi:hypothetical protein